MCKHPLKGFPIGITDNGKPKYMIVPYAVDHVEYVHNKWIKAESAFQSPYAVKCVTAFTEIPCGRCVDCKLKYSREWADRCMFEAEYYKPSETWFVNLTYDDDHIMDVGSDIFSGTLLKSDLSGFMKRLRRHCEYHDISKDIRFYACGEYGDRTHRPHYHVILYGVDLLAKDKLKYWMKTKTGFPSWTSPLLEKIWSKGRVVVTLISWDTCAYTARYCMKKVGNLTPDHYISNGVEPEFVLMSRRPGIGARYFEDHWKKIYETDEVFISGKDGGRKGKPPKYFDSKYEKINPDGYKAIKDTRREISEHARELKLRKSGMKFEDILEIEEAIMKNKVKMLKREIL